MKITNRHGQELAADIEGPEHATKIVILVHGFTSNRKTHSLAFLKPLFHKVGIKTLAYDAHGHGESYGEFQNLTFTRLVDDFLDVVNYAQSLPGIEKIGVFGSSMGGGTVTLGAARSNQLVCVAAKAPVSNWVVSWNHKFGKNIDDWKSQGIISFAYKDRGTKQLKYEFYEDLQRLDFYEEAKNISCPFLILQGTADESVPMKDSQKLVEQIPQSELILLEDDDHALSLTFEETLTFTANWIIEQLN